MPRLDRLVVATTNPGKVQEIRALLAGVPVHLLTLADVPRLEPPEETGTTFIENARIKACYYAAHCRLPVVAEDSGLEVDGMDGAPGVHSARFGGEHSSYAHKFRLIEEALAGVPARSRAARFVCSLVLATADRILFEAIGRVEGEIAREPRGSGGFGYDPIFFYPPLGCTLAEAGARKQEVSHRARAFRELAEWLKD